MNVPSFMNLGSCKPVTVRTGLKGFYNFNNFSGKGKPGGVCWFAWNWILEFHLVPRS